MTLDEFTIQQLRLFPGGTGELSRLLRDIGLAAKKINNEVNKAGLRDITDEMGFANVQGEEVKKLDVFANNQLIYILKGGMSCAGICSEEEEDIHIFDDKLSNDSKYVVLFDPLDGSSNIDTNISIGTIFSIYRRISEKGTACSKKDFLQPGNKQIAAGYIVYGSSTMFVYATKLGVNGFTLDPSIGEFCLSHANIRCPKNGKIYSVNNGYFNQFTPSVKKYIETLQNKTKEDGGPMTQRFTGSMVADLHRTLLKGGIFIYPSTEDNPQGRLRLLYECNPFAFIIERAGGKAFDGKQPLLDVQPVSLHQRVPIFIGSANMVNEFLKYSAD